MFISLDPRQRLVHPAYRRLRILCDFLELLAHQRRRVRSFVTHSAHYAPLTSVFSASRLIVCCAARALTPFVTALPAMELLAAATRVDQSGRPIPICDDGERDALYRAVFSVAVGP